MARQSYDYATRQGVGAISWDKEVWLDGRGQPHPELADALSHQQKDEP